jgi:hypothetical protein
MPYFPADEYGFTKEDRLKWAEPSVTYLVNNADISYLGDLKFDDGTPIYDERELSHMHDVKNVVQGFFESMVCSECHSALCLQSLPTRRLDAHLFGWTATRRLVDDRAGADSGMPFYCRGGHFAQPRISFGHSLPGSTPFSSKVDSWLFYYSDTLIRLFPIRFWQDAR